MRHRRFRIGGVVLLAGLLAVPVAGVDAVLTAPAAGAAVMNYADPSISGPEGVTAGPDGALWFTNSNNNSIGRITTGGAVTNFTDPSISLPLGITTGPDGALWFTNGVNNSIGRISTGGAVTNFTDPTISFPHAIVTGPDGALWFTNASNSSIGRITTAGVVTNFTDATIQFPGGIAVGPDGALWFADGGHNSIGRITTAGVVTNFTDATILSPDAIAAGPDGALWFTNPGNGSIGRITTGGTVTNFPTVTFPVGITAGPDGALWFTNQTNNSIGRITTGGTVTNYPDPSISDPIGITAGPDDALWFANQSNDSIGQIIQDFVPSVTGPVASSVTAPNDAVWTVPVENPTGSVLSGVTATLHAKANGSTPLGFHTSVMPGCVSGGGHSEVCTLADIPAHSTRRFNVFVTTSGLSNGTTVTGDVDVSASGQPDTLGTLRTVRVVSCGTACVIGVATPGRAVASSPGAPTAAHPTKQIVTLPAQAGAPPVAVTLKSINPGPKTSTADQMLCPTTGIRCSGQISVIAGNFKKYVNRAHPIRIQIIAKWNSKVPAGRMLMGKDAGGPPVQLANCVVENSRYNTPCVKPEVVHGSSAAHTLTTTDTILFVGTDPHVGRRVSNTPDAPTAVKASAAKKQAIVQWKAPVVTNGRLTGYAVTPHLGRVALLSVSFARTATKVTVKGLRSGKTYTFTVAAKNQHGLSYQSVASNAVKVK